MYFNRFIDFDILATNTRMKNKFLNLCRGVDKSTQFSRIEGHQKLFFRSEIAFYIDNSRQDDFSEICSRLFEKIIITQGVSDRNT